MKKLFLILLVSFTAGSIGAQFSRYVVKFRNKGENPFSLTTPSAYLSQRSIDRRTRYGIAMDSTDLPITPKYLDSIRKVPNVIILNASKWLNQVSIQTTDANAIARINSFPFVQNVSAIAARLKSSNDSSTGKFAGDVRTPIPSLPLRTERIAADYYNYGAGAFNEIHLHNGEFLHNIGLRGQGMIITMLDGGFFNYTSLHAFDSININGQVLGTWDFVARETSVTEDNDHGMQCLSTIAANIPGQFVGKAPKASFYLYRTEDVSSEYPIEEHNWACGAERADSTGSDVISTSLGYTTFDMPVFDHTYADLNGNITMAAIAADLAAKKGIIVFNSIGNIIDLSTHFLSTPADADSIIVVGSVNTSGAVASSSSYGPSSDGQVKPDVASVGVNAVVQGTNNTITTNNGTSFACPNMAGLGTCLWQAFPEYNNMKIINALRQAGNKFTTPDDRTGYGIPNMKTAFTNLLTEYATSGATNTNCKTILSWASKDVAMMKYEIERKAPGQSTYSKIGEVSGQGTILANHTYQFADSLINVLAGTISYRIREIVDTTTATFTAVYIDTANVNNASACITTGVSGPVIAGNRISISPNPANTQLTLMVETSAAVPSMLINIYDMKGRLMNQYKKSKAAGKALFDLPVSTLAKGKYVISIYAGEKMLGSVEVVKL